MPRARSAWWLETKSYARTIAPPPPRRASADTKKKKCSLHFGFARARFFLKKERTFFFLVFCPPSIRAGGGANFARTARQEGVGGRNAESSSLQMRGDNTKKEINTMGLV